MESTGKYWIPIFNILEDSCNVTITHPKYVKAIRHTFILEFCSWVILPSTESKISWGEDLSKKKSVHVSRAGIYLKPLLIQCANNAIRDKKCPYFKLRYDAIKKRKGKIACSIWLMQSMILS